MQLGSFNLHEFIDTLRWRRERLGIDMDGRATRIVKLSKGRGGAWAIESFTELDIDLFHASAIDKQRFKLTVRKIGNGLNNVAVNAEHPSLRVRRMSFARMPERDLLEAIRWNFREHIEGTIEKYIVGYTPLEEASEEGRVPVMAYGLSSEAIDEYLKSFKGLGLKLVSLEPAASALLMAFHVNRVLEDNSRHVCVAFGDNMTLFSVMQGHSVLFCRPLPGINHEALTRLVMRNLNLEASRAAEVVKKWSVAEEVGAALDAEGDDLMRRLETTIGHYYSQLAIEMQRSIDAFCIMYGVDRVDKIHICGMGIRYAGMVEHMSRTLGVETTVFNPFKTLMEPANMTAQMEKVAPMYAVAVGLAIP
jgi:type IV pilus assembly protein PilM